MRHLALGGLTCSEITQSPAKPAQLGKVTLPIPTQMCGSVNADRDCRIVVFCVCLIEVSLPYSLCGLSSQARSLRALNRKDLEMR